MNCVNHKERIENVLQSDEFYFQNLKNIFVEFKNYDIDNNDIDVLIKNLDIKPFTFPTYQKNNTKFKDFILLIGRIIAMSDLNGFNKLEWNSYDDKRTLARVGVRQNDFVKNLLVFKKDGINNVADSIKNVIKYIENPSHNLTQFSIKHRKLVAEKLLKTEFNEARFFDQLLEYFKKELKTKNPKNKENLGLLVSLLMYCDDIRDIWNPADTDEENQAENLKSTSEDAKPRLNQSFPQPLNQILYGPPGTGKTFNTIDKALEIIFSKEDKDKKISFKVFHDGKSEDIEKSYSEILEMGEVEERKYLKGLFDYYKDEAKQIVFTTFHQSFGYEEFVEGIKASATDKGIEYNIEPGIFKSLCDQAKTIKLEQTTEYIFGDKVKIWKISLGDSQNSEDDYIYEYCLENNKILLGFGEGIDFNNCNNRKDIATQLDDSKKYSYPPTALDTLKNKMKKDDIVLVSFGNRKLRAIAKITGEYEFLEDEELGTYVQSRSVKWLLIPEEPFTFEKVLKKQFSQMSIYDIKNNTKIESLKELLSSKVDSEVSIEKNYVLIIDEINRGNISKIFGELITLIEDSKRIGKDEEIRVSLPYSGMGDDGKGFGVPSNLYIIGTMNTADRSIALMDTALRRRFHFEEKIPELDVVEKIIVGEIKIKPLLETINKRIEYLYDRDHTIGHTYFMSLKEKMKDLNGVSRDKNDDEKLLELESIFRNKIIPLLQEYFYDDWEKIRLVLGDNQKEKDEATSGLQFIRIKKDYDLKTLFGDTQHELLDNDDSTKIYEISKDAFINPESYIKIYG